jgi:hypothetical protein
MVAVVLTSETAVIPIWLQTATLAPGEGNPPREKTVPSLRTFCALARLAVKTPAAKSTKNRSLFITCR